MDKFDIARRSGAGNRCGAAQDLDNPDDAYANAAHIPGGADYPDRWARAAQDFRVTTRARLDQPYGTGARDRYDLFLPDGAAQGTVVFVHGGYWKAFDRSLWSHLAAGPVARGWRVALPSYDLCPDVRIADITRQIAGAIRAITDAAPGPLVLTGHSAGGHLVARMVCADIGIAARRSVPISPLADLAPLMRTAMNATLRIDPAEAAAESPMLHPAPAVPVHVWVGEIERPAFRDQAAWLARAWSCPLTVAPGRHHFDVIEGLTDPASPLTEALCG